MTFSRTTAPSTTSAPFPDQLDIAIIGAGAAGIAAVRRLAATGLSIGVIEARDRVGGRAHTLDHRLVAHRQGSVEVGLDMGCGWLHSADENELAAIGHQAGFSIDETPPPWRGSAFNLGLTPTEQADFGQAFDAFESRIARAASAGDDHPASDQFAAPDDPDSRWNPRMDAISGALNGAKFAEVSTLDYDAYRDTGVNWRVREGYGRLISTLAQGLPVFLDCAVRRIDRSGPRLRIETTRGNVDCRAVILTVPTRLIGHETIRIDPPVPTLIEAALGIPLGLASKLHMTVERPEDFPADSQLWGRTDTAQTGGYHLRPFGRPMIEAYFGGDLAWGLEGEGEAAFFDFAVAELSNLLGSSFRRRLSPVATSMWGAEEWSRGAYSHCLPGHGGDRAVLKQPIENRIFIAGEATAEAFYGTAHGAWMEGERAAIEALMALGIDPRKTGGYEEFSSSDVLGPEPRIRERRSSGWSNL